MGESQHHDHHHPATYNRAFLIATIANSLFVVVQIFYAIVANSTSLLADAFHNMGDVLSLILAWIANTLMQRKPTDISSYGLKKSSILAALANGVLLVFTCGIIATEAFYKFLHPAPMHAWTVIIVASIGVLVNGATAALFLRGQSDLNIRGAYLHLFYDALVSVGVVFPAILMMFTHWLWLDPLVSLMIAYVILKGTWSLFTDSLRLMIDGVPKHISLPTVKQTLARLEGVEDVHDLHIWALSTQETALSVHLYMPTNPLSDAARAQLIAVLQKDYNISHSTIQVEQDLRFCQGCCMKSSLEEPQKG